MKNLQALSDDALYEHWKDLVYGVPEQRGKVDELRMSLGYAETRLFELQAERRRAEAEIQARAKPKDEQQERTTRRVSVDRLGPSAAAAIRRRKK